jgi:hypothetical protein
MPECPSCGAQIAADDAGCAACTPAPPVQLPPSLDVAAGGGELRIEWRWLAWTAYLMALVCAVWFVFLGAWFLLASTAGSRTLVMFALLHVAAGVVLMYATAAMFVNRTRIVVSGGRLTVDLGPLPWPGNRDIPTASLEQLYTVEHVQRTRGGTTITYSVRARVRGGGAVKLATGLSERDQALYIEQVIERHLGIPDEGSYNDTEARR